MDLMIMVEAGFVFEACWKSNAVCWWDVCFYLIRGYKNWLRLSMSMSVRASC